MNPIGHFRFVSESQPKFMVVQVRERFYDINGDEFATKYCYNIIKDNFISPEAAISAKNKMDCPENLIVVPYYV